jgi:threonine dehydrogenase-like Zn-dependent dehydrogenase
VHSCLDGRYIRVSFPLKKMQNGSHDQRFCLPVIGWAKSHSFHTGQTPVMKYNRQLMQAIMWDRIHIADIVGVEVISLDDAPKGYGEFDAGVPKKFVIDPHKMFSAA